ncbi:DUF1854 domain-containing protein [Uliginosibacterium sp. H3]|uniref:DUF1854 domain-containing protein n=1 Tax=Uliginosibacterium silvisoli TaxID=3114758 RepID=A0ABU6JY00_9RHOO|nr:DUF1854 domain-containing protein [Uliginosibacterium sp. H3]
MNNQNLNLSRNAFGRLRLVTDDGTAHDEVVPVRAFPISNPGEGISLVSPEGRELAWIERLDALSAASRALIEEELGAREFMPEIRSIRKVSTYATPSNWSVETDRGDFSFILKGEEDIRRVAGGTLLIADSHGVQFLIRDQYSLDRTSRRILDRFL